MIYDKAGNPISTEKPKVNYDMQGNALPQGQESWGDMTDVEAMQAHMSAARSEQGDPSKLHPVQWVEVPPEAEENPTSKVMYKPTLDVPYIAKKEGALRNNRMFFVGERQMFLMSFMNDISAYLFGVDCYDESNNDGQIEFAPNPEFGKLQARK